MIRYYGILKKMEKDERYKEKIAFPRREKIRRRLITHMHKSLRSKKSWLSINVETLPHNINVTDTDKIELYFTRYADIRVTEIAILLISDDQKTLRKVYSLLWGYYKILYKNFEQISTKKLQMDHPTECEPF